MLVGTLLARRSERRHRVSSIYQEFMVLLESNWDRRPRVPRLEKEIFSIASGVGLLLFGRRGTYQRLPQLGKARASK